MTGSPLANDWINVSSLPRIQRPTAWASVILVLFSMGRWAVAGHRHIATWVVAGRNFVSTQHWLPWAKDPTGYDGQFYWRLAADPFHLRSTRALGVQFDHIFRINRIAYPLVAWMLSLGQPSFTATALVIANVLAMIAMVFIAQKRDDVGADIRNLGALALLAIPGLVGALSRDLTEVFLALGIVLALWASDRQRWWLAGVGWSIAVLTKESALVFVVVIFVTTAVEQMKSRKISLARNLTWLAPAIVEIGWQLIARGATGVIPLTASGSTHDLGLPFVGFFRGAATWFHGGLHNDARSLLYVVQLAAFLVLMLAVTQGWRRLSSARLAIWIVAVLLVICESKKGWVSPFDVRYGVPAMVIGWWEYSRFAQPANFKKVLFVVGAVTLATMLWRIVII
jgi:hypothetical protein